MLLWYLRCLIVVYISEWGGGGAGQKTSGAIYLEFIVAGIRWNKTFAISIIDILFTVKDLSKIFALYEKLEMRNEMTHQK